MTNTDDYMIALIEKVEFRDFCIGDKVALRSPRGYTGIITKIKDHVILHVSLYQVDIIGDSLMRWVWCLAHDMERLDE